MGSFFGQPSSDNLYPSYSHVSHAVLLYQRRGNLPTHKTNSFGTHNYISRFSAETVAYLNIRVQQEGLNEAVLASELRLVASSGKGGVHYAPVKQAQQELV